VANAKTHRLVIVESPSKAKTIAGYLGPGYVVEASLGHVRDLPRNAADVPQKHKGEAWARLGVDVDNDFAALYVVSPDRTKQVTRLKSLLKDSDELLLATDEDREGEAIAWHLVETLKPKVPIRRMVFHEITRSAIQQAVANPRMINQDLVEAQEARRILDRLYGYEVSPVLWKKVMPKLSAGRVQSVATRIVVQRERERMRFHTAEYWDIRAVLAVGADKVEEGARTFPATLISLAGDRVATGRDFDPATGAVRQGSQVVHLVGDSARALVARLENRPFEVTRVEEKPYRRRPYAPFITSTLQQEAARKLRYSSAQTMRTAQRLYENGYITYMRTDSVNLSETALTAARAQIAELYGDRFVPPQPRQYTGKVKNAQEAHEAIRPAGDHFRTPGEVANELSTEEFKLYELIWRRTIASQMTDAVGMSMSVRIRVVSTANEECEFSASGKTITDPGFLKAYVESSDDAEAEADDVEHRLPNLVQGQPLTADSLDPVGHSTQPPARYTEASLVKALEELGIGRPSTYSSIMQTIQDRGYVSKRSQALIPSFLAFAVIGLLEQHFPRLVDFDFTAAMENELDDIAGGDAAALDFLRDFYFGSEVAKQNTVAGGGGLKRMVTENLGEIDARGVNSIPLFVDDAGREIVVRVGRYGPYLQRTIPGADDGAAGTATATAVAVKEAPANGRKKAAGNGGELADGEGEHGDEGDHGDDGGASTNAGDRVSLPDGIAPDELTREKVDELFLHGGGERKIGEHPETGEPIVLKSGRYGPYVTTGERNASLLRSHSPETLTLEDALKVLSLPRLLGQDAEGVDVFAGPGRYGPYVRRGEDYRSLQDEDQIFTVTLDEAQALLAAPKTRQRRAPAPPLRELGMDPITEKAMVIKDGRFGPYVTDGDTNASLRRGQSVEALSVDEASEMLAEKRAKGPAAPRAKATKAGAKAAPKKAAPAKKATKSTAAKSTAAKSTAAKATAAKATAAKSTAKKTTAKKTAAKKTAAKKAAPKNA
jgi:DNA topoisomerase-1